MKQEEAVSRVSRAWKWDGGVYCFTFYRREGFVLMAVEGTTNWVGGGRSFTRIQQGIL